MRKILLYLFVISASFISCNSTRPIQSNSFGQDYCSPTIPNASVGFENLGEADYSRDSIFNKQLGLHEYLMASATGTLHSIDQLLTLTAEDSSLSTRILRLEKKSEIQQRISRFRTELDGLSAELDCQGERADQLASYLENLDQKRTKNLTIASVIVGSVTTVVTVILTNDNAQNIAGISGGLLSAGLSAMTIKPKGKKMLFMHDRNLLHDIWYPQDKSLVYPGSVWYILSHKGFSNTEGSTLIESIKGRWKTFEIDDKNDINLLFNKGGSYTADLLHKRAGMLNQLQSTVRAINQDLDTFMDRLFQTL